VIVTLQALERIILKENKAHITHNKG